MSWNQILGHERLKKILQRAIIENKIAGAYCFWGIEGIGKDALAIEFAKTINCTSPVKSEYSIESCGVCQNCIQAKTLRKGNIRIYFALPSGKTGDSKGDTLAGLSEEQIKQVQEQISLKAEDPYHKISLPNANQIKIASIRELKKDLMMTSNTQGRRFIIISRFDEITTEAANAFLKTLEEPHENVTIILTTSRPEFLLQTILSRCQQVHCEPLGNQVISSVLQEKFNISPADSSIIASFAQGSYTRALEFLDEDMQQLRVDIIDMFRASLKKRIFRKELLEHIDSITKHQDKKYLETSLNLLLLWLRDAYSISKRIQNSQDTGSHNVLDDDLNAYIINSDQIDTLKKFVNNFPRADLSGAILCVEKSISQIRKNVNQQLILINLFLSLRDILLQ